LTLIESYFKRLLHDAKSTDAEGICDMLKLQPDAKALTLPLRLRDAADAFRLIDKEEGATVIVRYRSPQAQEGIDTLIDMLERIGPERWLIRKLQRYGVTVYQHQIAALLRTGDIYEAAFCPGLYVQTAEWDGFYDPILGARVEAAPGDPAAYVA
jgi:CRISPR-associated endonuclease/helicase Cas3